MRGLGFGIRGLALGAVGRFGAQSLKRLSFGFRVEGLGFNGSSV